MNRTERIKWQIFILLIVALGASIFYFSRRSTDLPLTANSRKFPAKPGNTLLDSLPQVSLLQRQLPEFTIVRRNVFEFAEEAPKPVTLLKPVEPLPETEPMVPIGPDVTYLGFYRENSGVNRKLAAISNGGQIYVGGQGEILAGKYRVLRVEDEFIEFEYLPENRVIRLEIGRHNAMPPLN